MKTTRYFTEEVLVKRPYLKIKWLEAIIAAPVSWEKQPDGRMRYWGYVEELGKVVRVVTLEDGTLHNAFPDRNYRRN